MSSDAAGRTVGDYVLDQSLGAGSLGEVFRAREARDGRVVALKILDKRISSWPGFEGRFATTLPAIASVKHENVAIVERYGEADGVHYVVSEFLAGGSLRALLRRRGDLLPLERAVDLCRQAAEALAEVHIALGPHRDLKPENFLLTRSEHAEASTPDILKLADAGLMKLIDAGSTLSGAVQLGALAYLSPEQCRGGAIDARTDLYAFGVVLYESATGLQPFQVRTPAEAAAKHLTAAPPPPRTVSADVPASLEAVILRCLEKDPAARFNGAMELATALAAVHAELLESRRKPIVVLATPHSNPVVPPSARTPTPADPTAARRRFSVHLGGDTPVAPRPAAPPAASAGPSAPEAAAPSPVRQPTPDRRRVSLAPPPPTNELSTVFTKPLEKPDRPTMPGVAGKRPPKATDTVVESGRIRVALDEDTVTLTPGLGAVIRVTLHNAGRIVDHFTLSIEGVPESWVQLPKSPTQLNPGGRAVVPVSIIVPRVAEHRAGTYPVTIVARSRDEPSETGTTSVRFLLLPFTQTNLTVVPTRARGWRQARYGVEVQNLGNAPVQYTLAAADEERALACTFPEKVVSVEPGATVTARMDTRASLRILGSTEHRGFTVKADRLQPDGSVASPPETQAGMGQFLHRALIPTWLPPLLVIAIVAAIFLLRGRGEIKVAVLPPTVQVAIGATTSLAANVTNRAGEALPNRAIAWTSRDTNIAVVSDSGAVQGRKEGTTLITASSGKVSATSEITVVAARVDSVAIAPRRLALKVGASAPLRAVAKSATGETLQRDFTWLTSDPTVVTVGGDGKVTAKAVGAATITAQADGKNGTADVTVAEVAPVGPVEDCVAYDAAALHLNKAKDLGFVITDGKSTIATLEAEKDGQAALNLARRYGSHCYLGRNSTRPNRSSFIIEYWKAPSGVVTKIDKEECTRYAPQKLRIVDGGPRGWELVDGDHTVLVADNQDDAKRAWEIAQQHIALCVIGAKNDRPNKRDFTLQYWKQP